MVSLSETRALTGARGLDAISGPTLLVKAIFEAFGLF